MLALDDDQRRAVDAGPGDLFISAGAGSGKTRVLTARFVSAVLGLPPYAACDPGELLTITFTDRAAGVLVERIRHELAAERRDDAARQIGDAWISTIHGMCTRVLKQHAFEAGLDPHFIVLDEIEAAALEAAALEDVIARSADDERVLGLLDAYGFDTVVKSVRRARSSVLALGLGMDGIVAADRSGVLGRLKAARSVFAESADDFATLRRLKTVEHNEATARTAAALLDDLSDDWSCCAVGVQGCEGLTFRRCGTVEGNDELAERCTTLVEQVRDALAQLAVAPLEVTFLRLLEAFDVHLAELKAARGALDFQDLQLVTAQLFEARPDIAMGLRDRFAMLMIDEFQDTDALQLSIASHLSHGNLCTVGDEHQSIYAFRSADVEVFRQRSRLAEHSVRLGTNYRTAPGLLDAINGLFSSSVLLGDTYQPLLAPALQASRRPWPEQEPRFAVRFCDTTAYGDLDAKAAEAECIAARVGELIDAGIAPGEIVVLLRAMRGGRADALRAALDRRSIPVFLAAGGDFFECREVAEARALLRAVLNPRDDDAIVTVLRGRFTGLSDDGLLALRIAADAVATSRDRRDGRLWAMASTSMEDVDLAPGDRAVLKRTVAVVEWARRQRGARSLGELILAVLAHLDADLALLASGGDGRRAWANLLKLARLADEYESAAGGDLGGLLEYLSMREMHAISEREAVLEGEASAVRVMSIHAAKGLEFPVVVVGALDQSGGSEAIVVRGIDGLPHLGMRLPGDSGTIPTMASRHVGEAAAAIDAAEAVRLLYVASTRAEESLTIVVRTDPGKDAGTSTAGLVRTALGLGAAGSVEADMSDVGAAKARVSVFRADAIERPEGVVALNDTPEPPPDLDLTIAGPSTAFGAPATVSYTGLSRYASCPYRYYATAIARLPAPPAAIGTDARAFGVAAHRVLERCSTPGRPSDELLKAAAAGAGLGATDVSRLRAAVETFLGSKVAADILAAERVMREAPIAVPIGGVVLAGTVDVIAWRGDEVLIADYKTGRGAPDDEAARERYRLQATCYALAALATGAASARVAFVEIETGREVEYAFRAPDRPMLEGAVSALTDRMRAGEYAPRGTYERDSCETCPAFGSLCPVTRPTAGGAD